MLEKLKIAASLLESANQTYLAKVSIAVAQGANAANDVVKCFGAVATLFVPLSFCTGLFGMNVRVPGGGSDSLAWFFAIGGSLAALTLLGFFFFRYKQWL
eukprot:TRINITY_DN3265_c0_g2_i2.p4 TRINITY_DN3265_c0_g2~~TRINITY_DN3265_c0_g2_i2.p4  ORF type:complete len:100 (-),score=41.11 TRINITY_DN3265_c0_g2_i2:145-444(-)